MFEVMNDMLSIYETSAAFFITNNKTFETKCMGDGVDMFTNDDGESIPVGSEEFYILLTETIDRDTGTLIEAYFGEGD